MIKSQDPKEPVRVRYKKLANGNQSIYLDIYRNGKRTYEFLKLYLIPETSRKDKDKNKETMRLVQAIVAQRIVEIKNRAFDFKAEYSEQTRFFDYYEAMVEKRHGSMSRGNWGNWLSALHHLRDYEKRKDITFAEITPKWVEGFKEYLDKKATAWKHDQRERSAPPKPLAKNSKVSYFNKLRACISQAFEDRIIAHNPLRGITGIQAEEGTRTYLTIEEVQRLAQTPCDYPYLKRAFLFSCLTGLRRSDIFKLTWGEVQEQSGFTRLIFRQKKTGGQEYLDITQQAAELMGERGDDTEPVFAKWLSPDSQNSNLRIWAAQAGIKKHISFHCGRHTFATMMLDLGTDLYTVSKLLGHKELRTTQIYAKVLDKNKQAAVQRIPRIIDLNTLDIGEVKE